MLCKYGCTMDRLRLMNIMRNYVRKYTSGKEVSGRKTREVKVKQFERLRERGREREKEIQSSMFVTKLMQKLVLQHLSSLRRCNDDGNNDDGDSRSLTPLIIPENLKTSPFKRYNNHIFILLLHCAKDVRKLSEEQYISSQQSNYLLQPWSKFPLHFTKFQSTLSRNFEEPLATYIMFSYIYTPGLKNPYLSFYFL